MHTWYYIDVSNDHGQTFQKQNDLKFLVNFSLKMLIATKI